MKLKLFVTMLGVALAGSVMAADQGGIQVGGNLNQSVKTGDNVNMAIGKDNTAKQSVGVIEGKVKVGGNLNQSVKTGDNVNMAIGKDNIAEQKIGVISGGK
ncbi:conserved exported hypothetical protein [Gammaproteobacteria bacterium]